MTAVATRSKTTNSGNNMSSPLRGRTNTPTTRSSAAGSQHQPGHDTAALNAAPVTSPSESVSGNSLHTASSITARTYFRPKGIAGTALASSSPISSPSRQSLGSPSRQGTAEGERQQYNMPADGGKNMIRRIRTPHPHDVLCGRGGGINSHPGNKSFRSWVRERKEEYNLATSKAEKARLSREIVDKVRNLVPPGRFLMREDRTATAGTPAITAGSHLQGIWIEIDDTRAMAKTSQALREGAPSIRAMHKKEVEASVEEGKETVSATSEKKNKTQFKAAGRAVSEAKRQQEAVRNHGANAMPTFVDTVPHNIAMPPSAAVQALATAAEAAKQSGAAPLPAAIRKKKDGGITSTNDMSPSHPGKRLLMPLSSMPPPPPPPFVSSADISKLGSTPAATTSMHKSKKQKTTNGDGGYSDELNQLRQENVISQADSMAPTPPPPETVVTSSSPYTAMPTWDGQTPPLQPIPMSPPGSKNGRGHNEHVAFGLPPPSVADPNLLNVFAAPPRPYVGSSPRKRKNMFRAHSLALSDMSSYEMGEDEEFHDPFENEELAWQLGGNGRGTFDDGMKSQGTSNENGQLGTTNENEQNEAAKKNRSESEKENEGEKVSEDYVKQPAVTPSSPCGKYRTNSNRGVNRMMRSLTSGSSHGDMGGIGALLNPPERQRSVSSGAKSNVISGNDGLGSRSSFKNMSSRSFMSDLSDLPDAKDRYLEYDDFNEGMKAVYDAAHPGLTSPRGGDKIPTHLYPFNNSAFGNSQPQSPKRSNGRRWNGLARNNSKSPRQGSHNGQKNGAWSSGFDQQ